MANKLESSWTNENQSENAVVSLWSESPTRPAGFRQTLKIGRAEYGFCWIPPGEFDMGSSETEQGRCVDEVLHHVKLTRGFWALETPTTQALYREVVGTNPSCFQGDDLPVETTSWDDANEFCKTLTERLPKNLKASLLTETQWEYACRAGTKTVYWYGDDEDPDMMNYFDSKIGMTSPVKKYPPNPWGLYDMHGNVYEWVLDWDYNDYLPGTSVDPIGTEKPSDRMTREGGWLPESISSFGSDRAMRGGFWEGFGFNCRSANRCGENSCYRDKEIGFRFLLIYD